MPAATTPPAVTAPAKKPKVILLVDWENTVFAGSDHGFDVSFAGIKNIVRNMGDIIFSFVFVSPYEIERTIKKDTAKNEASDVIRTLTDAGFFVVACPMGYKETDAADTNMNDLARRYLEHSDAQCVVIVSRDRDFRALSDFAKDMHKQVIFLDILQHREFVEGGDMHFALEDGRERVMLDRAFEALKNARAGKTASIDHWREYFKAIIICLKSNRDANNLPFLAMVDHVNGKLDLPWSRVPRKHLQIALTILKEKRVLQTHNRGGIFHYYLNPRDPVVEIACAIDLRTPAA